MAIDKSMINQFDDQLHSADYNNNLRNCPTPLLGDLIGNDLLESMGTFDSLEEIMASYPSMELQLLAEGNNSPITNSMLSQTALSNQFTAIMPSSNVHQSSNYAELLPSTSYLNSNSPFSFINESNTFKTIQPESSFHDDSKTPIIDDNSSNTMMRKNVNKEKCMTRNAVLARQNREKKKHEHHGLIKKVEQLEEENASLKKKYHDLRESYQNMQERNTYLEAVIQNLPEIVTMVEHMHKFPGNNTNVGSKN